MLIKLTEWHTKRPRFINPQQVSLLSERGHVPPATRVQTAGGGDFDALGDIEAVAQQINNELFRMEGD